ncbi:hypothetical protein [Variovorax sp. EBFNA2]|uniref:hypothetical protein n=1 Tax=Variovorax sp. EBFNA2 TaxID=3342097 RepID=UPI0029C0A87E|nr:hypothetical protein [Variovorax boronicumulans]WPG35336.1 hypothetical protein RZE79_17775 [Variovorax boronicumulans]
MPGVEPCPLCNRPASYVETQRPHRGKRFECVNCTHFFIDEVAEQVILNMVESTRSEARAKASKQAQASGPDRLYVMRAPKQNELGGDGHGVARSTMMSEWIPR